MSLFFLGIASSAHCRIGEITDIPQAERKELGPWFTGPLLTSSGNITPIGHMNLEPYLSEFIFTGTYDKNWNAHSAPYFYSFNPLIFFETGLTQFMSISTAPQFFYNYTRGVSDTVFGDLPIGLNFQLVKEKPGKWHPAIKFFLKELFPTGPYNRLDPDKLGTDIGGGGSYITTAGLAFSKIIKLSGQNYLAARLSTSFSIPSSVHVRGVNAYGGAPDTKGKIVPGTFYTENIGLELSLNLNWVLALDVQYNYFNRTRFSGTMGDFVNQTPNFVRMNSSNQISLAPAIEYNFNENMGIIAGSWFTVAGRNASRFVSGIIAFNYYTNFE